MPKTTNGRPKSALLHRLRKVVGPRGKKRAPWHWFDHPEMQARIASAEADRREGRVKKFDSRDAALAYLRSRA